MSKGALVRRAEFEHVIAAAANVTGQDEFIVIGSQAILGTHLEAPNTMLMSLEVDIYPRDRPDLVDEIDGVLGDGSRVVQVRGRSAARLGPRAKRWLQASLTAMSFLNVSAICR